MKIIARGAYISGEANEGNRSIFERKVQSHVFALGIPIFGEQLGVNVLLPLATMFDARKQPAKE